MKPDNHRRLAGLIGSISGWLLVGATLMLMAGRVSGLHAEEAKSTKPLVDELALPLVEGENPVVGLAVGILTPSGQREFFGYGHVKAGGEAPTSKTLFEIGSITKTVTALVLARMVEAGLVGLDDPVSDYLPAELVMPRRGEQEITLLELATHTSGLPRVPPNIFDDLSIWSRLTRTGGLENPWGKYDAAKLARGLKQIQLAPDPPPKYEYSNLGMGLLGNCLAHKAGMSYEDLVKTWVTNPLEMSDTVQSPSDEQREAFAVGHRDAIAVAHWTFDSLAGCGALLSTTDDLLKYLAAQCGQTKTELNQAMDVTQIKRKELSPSSGIGLAWHFFDEPSGRRVFWHNGGTGGFSTYVAFTRQPQAAVVALSNTSPDGLDRHKVDHLGKELLLRLVEAHEKTTEESQKSSPAN